MSGVDDLFQQVKEKNSINGLSLLRQPFPPHQISKLPKPTKAQTEELKANFRAGTRCLLCNGWHQPAVVHLDYVGHAALTDRLLDADPFWNWEPVATTPDGIPIIDKDGGMWIKLTICGVTRLGYGDAQGKSDANATKERIGDALRNAAMRFGAALDLWHKGDLHLEEPEPIQEKAPKPPKDTPQVIPPTEVKEWTPDNSETFEDLLGQGDELLRKLGMSEAKCAKWEQRYRGQKGDGDLPSKVFFRIGESIENMQKEIDALNPDPQPQALPSDIPVERLPNESTVSENWFMLRNKWLTEGMSGVHIANKIKKYIKEWTVGVEPMTPEWFEKVLTKQREILNESDAVGST